MRILIDMDEIICDLYSKWFRVYNDESGDDLSMDKIKQWNFALCVKPGWEQKCYEIIKRDGFFDDLPVLPGAVEGIAELVNDAHDVYFVTHPASADCARAKIEWVERHLGHLGFDIRNVFQMPYKSWLSADLMIDDRPKTIRKWAERVDFHPNHPQPEIMTIAYPYNEGCKDVVYCYAESYKDTQSAWETLVTATRKLSLERKCYGR